MPKDDVLTLKLPGDNLVFTRYLYIKDEVKTSLLISILNKSDDAIFWAYELYYSGYKNEHYAFIWQIYYDFFATLNPSFAAYLAKKLNSNEEDRLISSIIQNLLIRPFNTDVFLLRSISELFESDEDEDAESIERMIELKDYRELAKHILNNKETKLEDIFQRVLNYFQLTNNKDFLKENVNLNLKKEVILLANVLSIITFGKEQNLIKKKNFYVRVDPEEVVQYETIEATDNLKPYRILAQACTRKIGGTHSFLNLFQSFRNQKTESGLKDKYNEWTERAVSEKYNSLNNWLYHAAFSPVWFNRIKGCKGYVDYVKQEVKFVSESWEDEFHSKYNLEPDEQPLFVKENVLNLTKENTTWQQFFAKYKRNGLIDAYEEELDALNDEPLKY